MYDWGEATLTKLLAVWANRLWSALPVKALWVQAQPLPQVSEFSSVA